MVYCTVQDVIDLFRPLSQAEEARTEELIPVVTDALRLEAVKVGKDLDVLAEDATYKDVLRSVIVDIVARILMTPTSGAPMSQYSESAGGYSVSGTFLNAGGGMFIKKSELSRLMLTRQRFGVIETWQP